MNVIRNALVVLPALALVVAACSSGSPPESGSPPGPSASTPPASIAPSPTPIGGPVAGLDEAAAIVIASDPQFSGVTKLDPDMIGASRWWEGEPTATGFSIQITIGWGDCPSGCIERHVWSFSVTPDGAVTLDSETGDPLPAGSLPA